MEICTSEQMSSNPGVSVRQLLAREGVRPNRRIGQHFLTDRTLLARIARYARAQPTLEIGAGPGNLTVLLARQAPRVVAVEVDRRLVPILSRVTESLPHVRVVEADFLACDLGDLLDTPGPWACVSNLPYCASSPILFRLLEQVDRFAELYLSLQLEVAERLTASPGTRSYGRLSVMAGLLTDPTLLFRIPREAFYPRPEVESALVRLRPDTRHRDRLRSLAAFSSLVRVAFGQRRKQIRNALRSAYGSGREGRWLEEALTRARIDPTARAERVTVGQFVDLANELGDLETAKQSPPRD